MDEWASIKGLGLTFLFKLDMYRFYRSCYSFACRWPLAKVHAQPAYTDKKSSFLIDIHMPYNNKGEEEFDTVH